MEESILKLQLLEKKDLAEPEIDIRYSSMTQPLNRIVQYIHQQEYLIQGIFEKKLYQIPLNEVLYFETVDKKTFMYTQQKIFECKKTLSAIEQDLIRSNVVRISKTAGNMPLPSCRDKSGHSTPAPDYAEDSRLPSLRSSVPPGRTGRRMPYIWRPVFPALLLTEACGIPGNA